MTGAGTAELAFVKEDSFKTLPGAPTYYEPGRNPTVEPIDLERALERQRQPDAVFATEAIAQNIEGAFAVEFTMDATRQADVHDIVFNDTAPITLQPGRTASSRWFMGLDYLSGTAERELIGCVPVDYSVTYSQGGPIRVSISFIYADEQSNTSITPSSVQEATDAAAQFHGASLTVDGTTQAKEQSITLSISNISRFQRGSDPVAVDAVGGPAEVSLDVTAIFSEEDQLELAYGGSGQTATTADMDDVAASLVISAAGSTVASHELSRVKPATYSWEDLVAADADTAESITFAVTGDPAVAIT